MRVLLLDDDWFQRSIVTDMLTAGGFEFCGAARSPAEAMEMAKATPPDVIVASARSARDDSLGAAAAIRATCRCGLVLVGAHATAAARERTLFASANIVLAKPFTRSQLEDAVRLAARSIHPATIGQASAR
jgi:DNA-binding NarL/FixJ family response regulator